MIFAGLLVGIVVGMCGCGSSLVEPGRNGSPQPVVGQSPANPPTGTGSPGVDGLPHVPLSQLLPPGPTDGQAVYHETQQGETLSAIAARYRVPLERLKQANGLDAQAVLQPGQLIYIPGPG